MKLARVTALAATTTAVVLLAVPPVFAANGSAQAPDDEPPGAVAIVSVGPGGGSGEVQLTWDAVMNATGYRVLRSDTTDGEFEVMAEFDVTTGTATASDDVINVFSDQHSYIPARGTFDGPDESPQFTYIDLGTRQRCFRVIGFNSNGNGPASDISCGAPPGVELEPPTTTTTRAPEHEPSTTVSPATPATPVSGQPNLTG